MPCIRVYDMLGRPLPYPEQLASRIDSSFCDVPTDQVRVADVPVFEYGTEIDLVEACIAARWAPLVQGHNVAGAMLLAMERMSKETYDPNPLGFDGVLFRSWNIPVARFENSVRNGSGRTLVIELNMVAELERENRSNQCTPVSVARTAVTQLRTGLWAAVVALFVGIVVQAAKLRVQRGQ